MYVHVQAHIGHNTHVGARGQLCPTLTGTQRLELRQSGFPGKYFYPLRHQCHCPQVHNFHMTISHTLISWSSLSLWDWQGQLARLRNTPPPPRTVEGRAHYPPGPRTFTSSTPTSCSAWGGVSARDGVRRMSAASRCCCVQGRRSTASASDSRASSSAWRGKEVFPH